MLATIQSPTNSLTTIQHSLFLVASQVLAADQPQDNGMGWFQPEVTTKQLDQLNGTQHIKGKSYEIVICAAAAPSVLKELGLITGSVGTAVTQTVSRIRSRSD